jgi:hypothetical protein
VCSLAIVFFKYKGRSRVRRHRWNIF